MDNPLISVVVPTFNSESFLERCLKSVKAQSYSNIEMIVVDNYSSDRTREIAENGAKVVLCRAGRSKARNVGIGLAKGKFILSIDSDMELTSTVVEECINAITDDERIGGVIIPERSVGRSFWVKVRDFERRFYASTEVESARFFKKELVLKVKGFDEDIVYFEESTLPQKIESLGFNVEKRVSAEILHHEDSFSLWNWLKKKFHYGKTAWLYKTKYKNYASKQISISNRFFLFVKNKNFYQSPSLALGVIILKLLECLSAGLGLLTSELKT